MDEDIDIDSMSTSGSFLDMRMSIIDTRIDLPDDRERYKKDKCCIICKKKFGMGIGILHEKRHVCRFCYRGVCSGCSPQKVNHPEFPDPQRMCNNCYKKAKESQISDSFNQEINRAIQEKFKQQSILNKELVEKASNLKEKQILEEKLVQTERDSEIRVQENLKIIESIQEERNEILEKYQSLEKEIEQAELESSKLDKVYLEVQEELNKARQYLKEKGGLGEMRNLLAEKQDENVRLLRILDEKRAPPSDENSQQRKKREKIEKLNAELDVVNRQLKNVQEDNRNCEKEIQDINREIETMGEKAKSLREMEKTINEENDEAKLTHNVRLSGSKEEEELIKELRAIIQEQQGKIDQLKKDLERTWRAKPTEKELIGTDD
ncbi:unnamed protein product [Blepharisma stoltei]|uniref:FYVE-type domain-containing protein n=1 Tax=Blepharisma stoltei TaxID=1481888 RepID=A0AAU9J2F7_9CILI|nr:unnamed protein product [Blepharisma stoltei]